MADDRLNEIVQLVRNVRHDASSPLTAALGNVQLLLEEPDITGEHRESLRVVEQELRRLADMLRKLNEVRADG